MKKQRRNKKSKESKKISKAHTAIKALSNIVGFVALKHIHQNKTATIKQVQNSLNSDKQKISIALRKLRSTGVIKHTAKRKTPLVYSLDYPRMEKIIKAIKVFNSD